MKTFHFRVTEGDQLVDINQSINQSTSFKHGIKMAQQACFQTCRVIITSYKK